MGTARAKLWEGAFAACSPEAPGRQTRPEICFLPHSESNGPGAGEFEEYVLRGGDSHPGTTLLAGEDPL